MNFDEKVVDRIKKLEREVERLRVKESPDMSSYLGITGKAADSDKLDGLNSTDFVLASGLGAWVNWTPTLTGWTESLPAGGVYRYCRIGKLVILRIGMSQGTSNATVASMTLPFANFAWAQVNGTLGYVMNAGTWLTGACRWNIPGGGTSVNFYTDMASGAWTDSGVKRIYAVIIYEAA